MRLLYRFVVTTTRALARLFVGWRITGIEHLPQGTPYIVAGNHISMLDPPLIGSALPVEAAFIAKVELFRNPLFGGLIGALNAIPVRRGEPDRAAIDRALATLRGGRALVIFPEGTRDRLARLRPPKPGLGFFAVQTQFPVVPAYITGSNRLRRALVRRPRIAIAFGPPIAPPLPPADPSARRAAYDAVGAAWLAAIRSLADRRG